MPCSACGGDVKLFRDQCISERGVAYPYGRWLASLVRIAHQEQTNGIKERQTSAGMASISKEIS